MSNRKAASTTTQEANERVLGELPFRDESDFENARRGLIAAGSGQINSDDGRVVWDLDLWGFLDGDAPDTATPACGAKASSPRSPDC